MRRISVCQACGGFGQQAWNESHWIVLLRYPTVSNMLAAVKHIATEIILFFF